MSDKPLHETIADSHWTKITTSGKGHDPSQYRLAMIAACREVEELMASAVGSVRNLKECEVQHMAVGKARAEMQSADWHYHLARLRLALAECRNEGIISEEQVQKLWGKTR